MPLGTRTFVRATADIFEAGVLTVTAIDTGDVLATVRPDEWLHVIVRGPDGYADFSFDNPTLTAQVPHHPMPGPFHVTE